MLLYIKIKIKCYCNLHFFYSLFLIYMGVHCTCHSKSGKDSSTSLKNREITNQVNNPLLEDTTTVGVDNTDLWQALRPPIGQGYWTPADPFLTVHLLPNTYPCLRAKQRQYQSDLWQGRRPFCVNWLERKS